MRRRRRNRGLALVWTAVVLAALLAIVGLSCDTAYVVFCEQQLQTVADASALAAAETLRTNPSYAITQAQLVAGQNYAGGTAMSLATGDVLLGHYGLPTDPTPGFVAGAVPVNAVQVTARRTTGSPGGALSLIFGPAFGVRSVEVSRQSLAVISVTPARAIMLDPSDPDVLNLTLIAGGSFTVDGTIAVKSTSASAVEISGNGSLNASSLQIAGGYKVTGNVSMPSSIQTGVGSTTADPLAGLPEPVPGSVGVKTGPVLSPGYYPLGILLAGTTNYTLLPGLYIVDGSGFAFTGSGSITGTGVTLFLTDSAGPLRLTGSGTVNLTPPTSGTYAGITLFQGRKNSNASQITGTGGLNVEGTIYMPDAALNLTALSVSNQSTSYGNALIVWKLNVTGSAAINIPSPTGAAASTPPVLMQ